MTTVIDPAGTPVPVFNRSGVALVNITISSASPVSIPTVSGHTVVVVIASGSGALVLPTGAEVGDLVEIYVHPDSPNASINIDVPAGETFGGVALNEQNGGMFRKVSNTYWGMVQ